MRHGDKINNLGRKKAHKDALLANLGSQLIVHKRIVTTLAKAKALRTYIEPLITKTKKTDSQTVISHNHRVVFSYLHDKAAVKELFTVVGPKIASRPGGYTRVIKLGIRVGDNAEKAMIELVDFNEIYGKNVATATEPARRTRRGRSSGKGAVTASEQQLQPTAPSQEQTPTTESPMVTNETQSGEPATDVASTEEPKTEE